LKSELYPKVNGYRIQLNLLSIIYLWLFQNAIQAVQGYMKWISKWLLHSAKLRSPHLQTYYKCLVCFHKHHDWVDDEIIHFVKWRRIESCYQEMHKCCVGGGDHSSVVVLLEASKDLLAEW